MGNGKEKEFVSKQIQRLVALTGLPVVATDETLDGSVLLLKMMEERFRSTGASWYGLEAGRNDSEGAVFNVHLGQLRRPLNDSDREQIAAIEQVMHEVATSQAQEYCFPIHASVKVQEDGKTPERLQEELSKKPGTYELLYRARNCNIFPFFTSFLQGCSSVCKLRINPADPKAPPAQH